MPAIPPHVSVIDPLTPAIERVKTVLFRPFDAGRWLVIGFGAWLAQLGQSGGGGGGGFNLNLPAGHRRGATLQSILEDARLYLLDNLHWILPLAIAGGLVVLAIWVVFTWLSSRGHFIFLYCVAANRAEVVEPWNRLSRHGNSLFLFRLILGLITFGLMLPFLISGFWSVNRMIADADYSAGWILRLVLLFLGLGVIAIVSWLIRKLTFEFVTPIMFLQTSTARAGWRHFLSILTLNKARFLLYILFTLLLAVAIGFAVVVVVIATCCCAGCLLAIPYLGTVFLLPILVFQRAYSLYYLAQYGPDLDVFGRTPQPAAPL